ncbi:hypothetical protein [Photobacterium swingsii]|uniref:hypothetical protein n=1 Tax=Photobacterium swingsii TaxID=680026 RepID=UPI004068DF3A
MKSSIVQLNNYGWMPYKVPIDVNKQAICFGEILSVPAPYLKPSTEGDVKLMVATILYPHVDRFGKNQILRMYHEHPNKKLAGYLRGEAVTVTLVNRNWGLWSLSTSELNDKLKQHEVITKLFGIAGVKTAQDLVKDFKSLKNSKPYAILLSVILTANELMKKDTSSELERRKRTSDYEFK